MWPIIFKCNLKKRKGKFIYFLPSFCFLSEYPLQVWLYCKFEHWRTVHDNGKDNDENTSDDVIKGERSIFYTNDDDQQQPKCFSFVGFITNNINDNPNGFCGGFSSNDDEDYTD